MTFFEFYMGCLHKHDSIVISLKQRHFFLKKYDVTISIHDLNKKFDIVSMVI